MKVRLTACLPVTRDQTIVVDRYGAHVEVRYRESEPPAEQALDVPPLSRLRAVGAL